MTLEQMVTTQDAVDFADIEAKVETLMLLDRDAVWPCPMRLPVKRENVGTLYETGYVQRERDGRIEPAVRCPDALFRLRSYASVEQLVEAGWRVD